MKLALECPISHLEVIQPLADFDWILTHLVIHNNTYAKFYKHSRKFKVLDNSVNELLKPCSIADMVYAAEIVKPNLIVSPDWLGDGEKTFKAYTDTFPRFFEDGKALPVIQGETVQECLHFGKEYSKLGVRYIAVPYDITCKRGVPLQEMRDARVQVVSGLEKMGFDIHLLGMTTLDEFDSYSSGIISIDTGVPVKHGLLGNIFGVDKLPDKNEPTMSLMDPKSNPGITKQFPGPVLHGSGELEEVFYNIAMLRRVIQGGG